MMDQKNLLIAIVLSVAILFTFQFLFEKYLPHPPPPAPTSTSAPTQTTPASPAPGAAPSPSGGAPGTTAPQPALSRTEALAGQTRVKIDTPRLKGSIDLTGGAVDDLRLVDYHEGVDPHSPDVILLEPAATKDAYFARFGWASAGSETNIKLPGPQTVWTATPGPLSPTHPVTLTWDNGAGLVFTRTISIDQNYMFTLHETVRNTGSAPVALAPQGWISRATAPAGGSSYSYREAFQGFIGSVGGGGLITEKYSSVKPGQPHPHDGTDVWLGFSDEYWLTALIPPQDKKVAASFAKTVDGGATRYEAMYRAPAITVPPGQTGTADTRFFAGAKEVSVLDAYADTGISHFDRAIDFGWLFFLSKPIFLMLQYFNDLLGNFGLAILLFTFVTKLAFFPLANKSYAAMSKMKLLQPEMAKIREKYPDDKAKQQQEIMALYKKVGANPLAGCLPIVIQIPVFWALYEVLYVTVAMRHAPFYGWIHDLSAPDPTSFANLFGLLPYAPPHYLMIGAWPLIMGVTMFLQQKLNPQPVDPMQARMFMFLPIVFTYMLASFPAGLVIYWSWNNLLSIAQQWAIMHKRGAV